LDENWIREMEQHPLEVVLSEWPFQVSARYELGIGVDIIASGMVEDDYEAAFVEAIRDLRHGLALANTVGKMQLGCEQMADEAEAGANRAIDSFTEEELSIKWVDVARAHKVEAERTTRFVEHLGRLMEFMEAQKREEDENITLREAEDRAREGTEQMRRMVEEGEEE
jgi:hypothetical protein